MYSPGRKKDGQCAKHCRSPACRDVRALAIRPDGVNIGAASKRVGPACPRGSSAHPFPVEPPAPGGHGRAMRFTTHLALAAPFLILLGSCVGPATRPASPAPAPAPRPAQASAPVRPVAPAAPLASDWQYRTTAPGDWRWQSDAAMSIARFGPTAADPRLTIRCDRAARRINIIRAGAGQGTMTLRTSYGATSWPATATITPVPQTIAVRAAADTALDQMAYSRGKFAIEVMGLEPLIVPAWPEVSRVIEDCRG